MVLESDLCMLLYQYFNRSYIYILKIDLFLGLHTIMWNKKSALKCFKCYNEKRLHNFVNMSVAPVIMLLNKKLSIKYVIKQVTLSSPQL